MLFSLLLTAATPMAAIEAADPNCAYDRDAMLALDFQTFDQDPNGGWRALANEGCYIEAAELIREWRYVNRSNRSTLFLHEGQMRAFAGQTMEAVELFQISYKSPIINAESGCNHYVDATIFFLVQDRELFDSALESLAATPLPEDSGMALEEGGEWPPNIRVVRAMERCWERSYLEAYMSPQCYPHLDENQAAD